MKNSLPGDGENDDESYDTFRNMAVVPSVGLFPNFLFFRAQRNHFNAIQRTATTTTVTTAMTTATTAELGSA